MIYCSCVVSESELVRFEILYWRRANAIFEVRQERIVNPQQGVGQVSSGECDI